MRAYDQIAWSGTLLDEPASPVMILSPQFAAKLDERKSHQAAGIYELRPGVFLTLFVEPELWRAYLAAQSSGQ